MHCCACAGVCNHIGPHSFCADHGNSVNQKTLVPIAASEPLRLDPQFNYGVPCDVERDRWWQVYAALLYGTARTVEAERFCEHAADWADAAIVEAKKRGRL